MERAYRFLAEIHEAAALGAVKAIREKALLLEQFPNAERTSEDCDPEHRELLIPFGGAGYVLVCTLCENNMYILALKHQREAEY